MRKRSKNKATIDKADRAVQDFYRAKYPNRKCEVCLVNQFYCVHHFIEKSKSNSLRFNSLNLIFICKRCHSLHHCFGDSTIHAKIIEKRGLKWWIKLEKENKIKKQYWTGKELESIISYYQKWKPKKSIATPF